MAGFYLDDASLRYSAKLISTFVLMLLFFGGHVGWGWSMDQSVAWRSGTDALISELPIAAESEQPTGVFMFRCQLCQSVVPAGTRASKVVLVTRDKSYAERGGQSSQSRSFGRRGRFDTPRKNYDKGGEGQEIVREASVCPTCAEKHERQMKQEQEAAQKQQAQLELKRQENTTEAEGEETSLPEQDA